MRTDPCAAADARYTLGMTRTYGAAAGIPQIHSKTSAATLGAATLSVLLLALSACGVPGHRLLQVPQLDSCRTDSPVPTRLRVVSYNIRSGLSSSVESVAETIEDLRPQIVALQEVDRDTERSGGRDQLAEFAGSLGLLPLFYPARREEPGWFGNALLSSLPVAGAQGVPLDATGQVSPRSALDVEICLGAKRLRVVVVHADVFPWASSAQCAQLADRLRDHVGRGLLVLGDFNQQPDGSCVRDFAAIGLQDLLARSAEAPTYQGDRWPRRLDYIFADGPVAHALAHVAVIESPASDHKPVMASFETEVLQRLLPDSF